MYYIIEIPFFQQIAKTALVLVDKRGFFVGAGDEVRLHFHSRWE
jgi:hypothetical protein